MKPISDLEDVLGYKFVKAELLQQALIPENENHSMVCDLDQASLIFIGDAALKYTVIHYLCLNKRSDVIKNSLLLNNATQTVISNSVLADIAHEKFHLEEYGICRNEHKITKVQMHANCMKGIFGAVVLDCGLGQQEVIYRIVEKLFSDRYETLMKPILPVRIISDDEDVEEELVTIPLRHWCTIREQLMFDNSNNKSRWKMFIRFSTSFFAGFGFVVACALLVMSLTAIFSRINTKRQSIEL